MDKTNLILILKEWFQTDGNYAYLHLNDGSNLLIIEKPQFNNLHLQVQNNYDVNSETVHEVICIPYTIVNYISLTNSDNLRIITEQYDKIGD